MKENQKYRELTYKFLQGNLSVDEEYELLEVIKSGEYSKDEFLKDQKELQPKIIISQDQKLDNIWKELSKRIEEEQPSVKLAETRTINRRSLLAIAAAFVIGVIISSAFYFWNSANFYNQSQVQDISVPYGAKSKIILPDGSSVWLNSGSRLSYPLVYRGKRTVTLEGEAYFDVVKNKIPFIVSTKHGDVQVLGTSFNVKAFSDEEFQTTLVEGSVRLSGFNGEPVLLKPGEQAAFEDNQKLIVSQVDTEIYTSWKDGKLIFYREPFAKVASRLERWYNVKIVIDNEDLKSLWFTGTIEMETFPEFMALIVKSYPIKYTYDQSSRTLIIGKK